MNLYLVANKVKVIAAGVAGASYVANKEAGIPVRRNVKLLKKNVERGFDPRIAK